ncbi:hypothetical protein CRG98_045789 [Punica granatum]|uniref:Photosystem II D1 precursor processing protein PSB27-H2, chloroplastic n=1 Tax=Punica granatum TaxID=22663 RepID=A0A2I0HQT6_PUNGR|nr:hypothetical protein CRG98_045789 [Punica granatum]
MRFPATPPAQLPVPLRRLGPLRVSLSTVLGCTHRRKLQCRSPIVSYSHDSPPTRRDVVLGGGSIFTLTTLSCIFSPLKVLAAEKSTQEEEEDKGVIGAVKSLFDPNEKTKSGKVLPKAYLKSAREVVKNLRESLQEDPKDVVKFRRTADAAKESIRDYLGNWTGQQTVAREESYVILERAIRSLASFYSKAGPSAPLPDEVKSEILDDLSSAEEFL